MGILIQPKRWAMKPPLGAQINWGHPLAQGLVGCWLFNEAGGGIVKDALCRLDGTFAGTAKPSWVDGPFGKAINFVHASTSWISLPSDPALLLTGPMTWVGSVKPGSTSNYVVMANTNSDGSDVPFDIETLAGSAKLTFVHVNSGVAATANGNTSMSVGTWYRVGVTRAGNAGAWTFQFYMNGIADGTSA